MEDGRRWGQITMALLDIRTVSDRDALYDLSTADLARGCVGSVLLDGLQRV